MGGALGVVLTGDTVPLEGRHAIPAYVDDSLPIVGPSRACVVVSGDEIPRAGGPAIPVRLAPDGTPATGPALLIYLVSGSLSSGPSAPVNTVLPAISGTLATGATQTATTGTWTNSPTSYTYQWKRNGSSVGGATNSTYILQAADAGTTLTVAVTATNAGGSATATSAGVAIPNLLDTFTDVNGTALASHTMDIGGGWTAVRGVWQVQSNRAQLISLVSAEAIVTANAGIADYVLQCVVNLTAISTGGAVVRYGDVNNFFLICIAPSGDTFVMYERVGGAYNSRASAAVMIDPTTDYTIRVTCSGATITATVNGANQISYASATANQASTVCGIRSDKAGDIADSFQVVPPP